MDITNKSMVEPSQGYNYLEHLMQFIKDIAPFGSAIWICKLFIDRVFKERQTRHDARLREIANEVMMPEITDLKSSIQSLTRALGAVEQQLKERR